MPRRVRRTKRKKPVDIAIVGIDGSGKTTISRSLQQMLSEKGLSAAVIDPPHLRDFGGAAGKMQNTGMRLIESGERKGSSLKVVAGSMITEFAARSAKRASRKKDARIHERPASVEIRPMTKAYLGARIARIIRPLERPVGGPLPDVAVLLKLDPEKALARIAPRESAGRMHESLEKLSGLQEDYEKRLAELERKGVWVYEIDASTPKEEVLANVKKLVEEKKLIEKRRKRYLQRKREEAKEFAFEGIKRWVKGGKVSEAKARELEELVESEALAPFLRNFGIHNAISGIPLVTTGTGMVGRPIYTAAARTLAGARRLSGKISAEEYNRLKRMHSGEAMAIGLIPFFGRSAYIFSIAGSQPELFGILADQFAFKKLGKLYSKFNIGWKIEKVARGTRKYLEFKIMLEQKVKGAVSRKKTK